MVVNITLMPAALQDVRRIRDLVLRPEHPPGGSVYPGDENADTLHLGAYLDGQLVAVASICRESPRDQNVNDAWRLRGMAALDGFQGRGIGGKLLEACIEHARQKQARLVWCSARTSSADFYRRRQFVQCGEPYQLPQFSAETYILMTREPQARNVE